jgi:hypothetical protein
MMMRTLTPDRYFATMLRPRHLGAPDARVDRSGDTPLSSKYFKITNITAIVNGTGGSVNAVNDDGRMLYNDAGNGEDIPPQAFLFNNGLTWGQFAYPGDPDLCGDLSSVQALALNENAEAVGNWGCLGTLSYAGWSLSGATDTSVAYYGNDDDDYAEGVNDHDVAVGCYGDCGIAGSSSAAVFEPSSSSSQGRIIQLRGLKGRTCSAVATAINDAGEIVGVACDEAVRFSLSGYAEPLPVGSNSVAEAINKQGDVVGMSGNSAFLYHLGKKVQLPKPSGDAGYTAIAFSINASDEIVGSLYGRSSKAFVYLNGHAYDLQTLIPPNSGWTIADAYGVNDHGEIVGDGYYNGILCGISLKPPV